MSPSGRSLDRGEAGSSRSRFTMFVNMRKSSARARLSPKHCRLPMENGKKAGWRRAANLASLRNRLLVADLLTGHAVVFEKSLRTEDFWIAPDARILQEHGYLRNDEGPARKVPPVLIDVFGCRAQQVDREDVRYPLDLLKSPLSLSLSLSSLSLTLSPSLSLSLLNSSLAL